MKPAPSGPDLFLVAGSLEHVLQGHYLPLQLVPLPQEANPLLVLLNMGIQNAYAELIP